MSVPASWSFLDTVCRAMLEFKCYQYFPDPDGFWDGPSGYSGRTGGSYVYDQRNRTWREVMAVTTFEEGYPLSSLVIYGGRTAIVPDLATAISNINTSINWLSSRSSTRLTTTAPAWGENHWQTDSIYFPGPAWYTPTRARITANGDDVKYPFEVNQSFNKSFNDEFWAYRSNIASRHFGFFVECTQNVGSYNGWYGGSIQVFWTPETGTVVLAKHNKSGSDVGDNENTRVWSEIDTWATQHVWGRGATGAFACCCVQGDRHPVTPALAGNPPTVTVATALGPSVPGGQQTSAEITGTATFTNQFTALSNGVRTNHTITSDGVDQITELWATIPVYLRNAAGQSTKPDTTIEYWTGSAWATLTTTLAATQYLRLGRNFGSGNQYAYVAFSESHAMKLSASVWQQSYQGTSRIRNVHIDLHGNPGTAIAFPASVAVGYSFVVDDPTA